MYNVAFFGFSEYSPKLCPALPLGGYQVHEEAGKETVTLQGSLKYLQLPLRSEHVQFHTGATAYGQRLCEQPTYSSTQVSSPPTASGTERTSFSPPTLSLGQ